MTGCFLSSSLSSHQSQIAIAATMRMMTTMSGQFNLLNENPAEACATCGTMLGEVATGAVFAAVGADVPGVAAPGVVAAGALFALPFAAMDPVPAAGVVAADGAGMVGFACAMPVPAAVPAFADPVLGIVIAMLLPAISLLIEASVVPMP